MARFSCFSTNLSRPLLSFLLVIFPLPSAFGQEELLYQKDGLFTPPKKPTGFGYVTPPPVEACISPDAYEISRIEASKDSFMLGRRREAVSGTLFDWPIGVPLSSGLQLHSYFDHDTSSSVADYETGAHTYDGHRGTDIGVNNFRDMDRGMPILAAADGIVTYAVFWYREDRNTGPPPFPSPANWVAIRHSDGLISWYYHLRWNSLTVEVGDTVSAGEMIGLVGSSGFSYRPHLHFEPGEVVSNVWQARDPFQGSNQPLPSLWVNQEPYVGDDPISIFDLDIFTETAVGGDLSNIPANLWWERITAPAVMGANESKLAVWVQLQGQQGDSYRLEVRRPNGSLFGWIDYSLLSKMRFGHHFFWWPFSPVSPSDYGTWTYTAIIGGQVVKQVNFEVAETTVYAPRFWPVAGRSFRIGANTQQDTLRVSSLGEPVTYSLVNAPSFVSLVQDSIVEIGPASVHPQRSQYFQAVATDGTGRTDTMWYHLVDPAACLLADLTPPTVQCPLDIVRCGNPVATFSAVATDNCTQATVVCTPPSGSSFPVGTTAVNCVGTDAAGNKDSCQFNVTVTSDAVPPVVQCPNDTTVTKCTDNPRVNFTPLVSDDCEGATVSCVPPSGSLFSLGTNMVTCIGADGAGNKDTCQFNVTVVPDTAPPIIQCPADKMDTVQISDSPPCSLRVFFTPTDLSDNCGIATFGCTPPTGSYFPVGSSMVTCAVTDLAGLADTCSFSVTVARMLGDLNGDGALSPADVVLHMNCVFLGAGNCTYCFTDLNCDGNLSPADVVLELNQVFLGVPLPCSL